MARSCAWGEIPHVTHLLIVVLVLLFGGGRFYGHRRGYYGEVAFEASQAFLVLIVSFVSGGLGGAYPR
jgi:hypothetical protein